MLKLHTLDIAMPLERDLAEIEAAFVRSRKGAQHG
jgi:hypothetical protein